VVRQGTDDELSSSPADRDAWARAGTMTGSNLAVSGKAAWFGTSTAGESRRMVRAGTSPDEELAVTGLRIFRADSGHSFSYSLPRLRIAGPLRRSPVPGGPGSPVSAGQAGQCLPRRFPSTLCSVEKDNCSRPSDTLLPAAELTFCNPQN
jgi:hypothetical protein